MKCKISFECILKIRIIITKIDDLELHLRDQKLENSKKLKKFSKMDNLYLLPKGWKIEEKNMKGPFNFKVRMEGFFSFRAP